MWDILFDRTKLPSVRWDNAKHPVYGIRRNEIADIVGLTWVGMADAWEVITLEDQLAVRGQNSTTISQINEKNCTYIVFIK